MTDAPALLDSRRLPGTSRLMDGPGVVLDVHLPAGGERVIAAWARAARAMLRDVGWPGATLHVLRFPGGASLAHSAPADCLYAATEVNEWAWAAAVAETGGPPADAPAEARERLLARIGAERKPALLALRAAADAHGVECLGEDRRTSIGLGAGSRTFETRQLPEPSAVPWDRIHDVPVALVTGTDGKTTTTRLLAHVAAAAGHVTGFNDTDGVTVAGERVASGDYSGPEGARLVLRDPRVTAAVLETARGGILRRGLAVRRAGVAVVTNVAADHFGEFGVFDLPSLADTKLVVARAVGPRGRVVLNAEDPELVRGSARLTAPLAWFALDPAAPAFRRAMAAGLPGATVEDGRFVLVHRGTATPLAGVDEAPVTLGGAARYNVANALAAALAAWVLGLPVGAIRAGLTGFARDNAHNPGRLNRFQLDGAQLLVDFAHNPHGLGALAGVARALPAARRLVVIGQAGDRDDEAIRGLARAAWAMGPDRVILKEMPKYLRGRAPGEIPAMLRDELRRAGAPDAAIEDAPGEVAAVEQALAWARPGDLLLLTVHAERDAVLALLAARGARGWSEAPATR